MAIADDISIDGSKNIRYTGNAHGAAGAGYYTVLQLHRFLGDLSDDAVASGDDLVDITKDTPSDKAFDTIKKRVEEFFEPTMSSNEVINIYKSKYDVEPTSILYNEYSKIWDTYSDDSAWEDFETFLHELREKVQNNK